MKKRSKYVSNGIQIGLNLIVQYQGESETTMRTILLSLYLWRIRKQIIVTALHNSK